MHSATFVTRPLSRTSSRRLLVLLTGLLMVAFAASSARAQEIPNPLKIKAGDAVYAGFGGAVALEGDVALVGAIGGNDTCREESANSSCPTGEAYFFRRNPEDGSWTQTQALAPDGLEWGDSFGTSVALSGDYALVGAPYTNENCSASNPQCQSGTAYVYKLDRASGQWILHQKLLPSNPKLYLSFGQTVSLDGDRALLTAPGDNWSGRLTGSAYVFERNPSTDQWEEVSRIRAADGREDDRFGLRTGTLDGDFALIGSPLDDNEKGTNAGAVYVFQRQESGTWQQVQKIVANDGSANKYFGDYLAMHGTYAVVGVYQDDTQGRQTGVVYVLEYNGTTWVQRQRIYPEQPVTENRFGINVAVNDDWLLIGDQFDKTVAHNAGAVFLYSRQGSVWRYEHKITTRSVTSLALFGNQIALDGNRALIGSFGDDSAAPDAGSAHIVDFAPPPVGPVTASDEASSTSISVRWSSRSYDGDSPFDPDGIRIYRDGTLLTTLAPTATSYDDTDDIHPGAVHTYSVTSYNEFSDSGLLTDVGRARPSGEIEGRITPATSTRPGGVPDVPVCVEPLGYALAFDGNASVALPGSLTGDTNALTFEAWVFLNNGSTQTLFDFAASAGTYMALHAGTNGPEFIISRNGSTSRLAANTPLSTGTWHHVAVALDGSNAALYVDGEPAGTSTLGTTPSGVGETLNNRLGAPAAGGGNALNGRLDEVRLWSVARTAEDIRANHARFVNASETGLTAYWRFDAGDGTGAYDYTRDDQNGRLDGATWTTDRAPVRQCALTTDPSGAYTMQGVYYGEGTTLTVRPDTTGGRRYTPEFAEVRLEPSNDRARNIDFLDESSFTVSGTVVTAAPSCPVPGVHLVVDGETADSTDASGAYTFTVQAGQHTIEPVYFDHTFDPPGLTRAISGDTPDLTFTDPTTYTLSGKVVGGSCDYDLGEAELFISTPDACFTQTIRTQNGRYEVELPALPKYTVQVTSLTHPTAALILPKLQAQEVSLAEGDQTLDFIYRAEPEIQIDTFEEASCSVPVLEQNVAYEWRVDVVERYDANTVCPADSGTVTIFDAISDAAEPLTVNLDSTGSFLHTFKAGVPNIVAGGANPHQKLLQIEVETAGGTTTEDEWVIVTGNRPREKTFATVSPELPLFILRDPPGDASYSYLSEGTSQCVSSSLSLLADASVGTYSELKAGVAYDVSVGEFVSVSTGYASWGTIGTSLEVGATALGEFEQEVCLNTTRTFSTSGNNEITGAEGDVFVGAAQNLIYALTDVLEVNNQCEVDLSVSVIYGTNGFATRFLYTEEYLRETLIPELIRQRELATDRDKKQEFADAAEVWQQTLALNEKAKQEAEPTGLRNISFSGNAAFEETTEATASTTESLAFNLYIDSEVAVEAGFEAGGSGFKAGVQVRARTEMGTATSATQTHTNTTGFVLSDDDSGDAFSVDIKTDPVFGTPVFDLVSGRSLCPWEPGTLPREGVQLTVDQLVQTGIDPNQAAAFRLTLGNTSQSDESHPYQVSVVQESNPDGAVVSVGGVVVEDALAYTLPAPPEGLQATMTVARGPIAYHYENLQLELRSLCDPQIADTVAVTVRFESPCSMVDLVRPEAGWTVSASDHDSLQVILSDYDRSRLSNIALQYSPAGKNTWKPATLIPAGNLPGDNAVMNLNTEVLEDGAYDLRAAVQCDAGVTYSSTAAGQIDRTPPVAFGLPEPSGGILGVGTEISVSFDEPIDCTSLPGAAINLSLESNGAAVPVEPVCEAKTLTLMPAGNADALRDETLLASVSGIADQNGNVMQTPVTWSFVWRSGTTVDVEHDAEAHDQPTEFALDPNYPNPFNPRTQIPFALKETMPVRLEVFNALGQRVQILVDETRNAGHHQVTFEAAGLPSGLYLYRLTAGDFVEVRKMMLVR